MFAMLTWPCKNTVRTNGKVDTEISDTEKNWRDSMKKHNSLKPEYVVFIIVNQERYFLTIINT